MSYFASQRPDITESIPSVISARAAGAAFQSHGIKFDIAIAGMPFCLALNADHPYQRQTAQWKKTQIDTSREPGEQTLNEGLWLRSQNSWHKGSGINFYEPTADPDSEYRSASSVGVDVWTRGQVTLLHAMDKLSDPTSFAYAASAVVGGIASVFINTDGTLTRQDASNTASYSGSTALTGVPCVAGSSVVVGSATGLWKGSTAGSSVSHQVTTTGSVVTPYWVKSRLIVSQDNKLYAMATSDTSLPATPLYVHPDSAWVWTSVTETTDAILAAGYSNGYGAIYRFSLTATGSGDTPTLSQAFQIAEFPPGEQVYAIKAYLGKYIAIGTSLGLRIGVITGATSVSPTVIQYGPLTIQTTQPVTCLAARDSYVYAGISGDIDGNSGCARVSLEAEITTNSLRFPWAYDAQTHVNDVIQSLTFLGNTSQVMLTSSAGVYLQSIADYEPTGYVLSGKVRFATSEPKAYRLARVRAQMPNETSVALATVALGGAESQIIRLKGTTPEQDLGLTQPMGTFEYMSFRLTLGTDDDTQTMTPILESFTIKAVPAPPRQREIQIPVMCYNSEFDRNVTPFGSVDSGFGADRLFALEALENLSAVVSLQDFRTNETKPVQIEQLTFINPTPPSRGSDNFAGVLLIQVREV